MAYKKADLEKQALEAIKKHNLFFIQDVAAFLPCSRSTFYGRELDKLDSIKDALEENRIRTKNGLRAKWFHGNAPATQIALYKLLADEDEIKKLSLQHFDHTTKGDKIGPFSDWTDEQLRAEYERLSEKDSD